MAIELETLEVLLKVNTENIQKSVEKVFPQFEKMLKRMESMTGSSFGKTEKNMSVEKGSDTVVKQLEKINKNVENSMKHMESITEKSAAKSGTNLSKGFAKVIHSFDYSFTKNCSSAYTLDVLFCRFLFS